ncbi:MAG TPA: flavodoxin domain-containing protein [Myxococcaceae bacterium]|nr:flavodoxin domain-containing protein [Myxococcaceae bacterium]
MASVLVVYATHDGQTRKIAERIATMLRIRRHVVELLDASQAPREVDFSRFQVVFLGSPVRAQGYLRPFVRFIRSHRTELARVPTLFFSVNLAVLSKIADGKAQTLELVNKLLADTGWRPRRIELVAGALPYTRYNFLVRFLMRRIVQKEGGDIDTTRDYEYTDWAAVDRFAVEFVERNVEPHPAQIQVRPRSRPPELRA